MSALRILHLYPRELGINGDAGNVMALAQRAQWRGLDVDVLAHSAGDVLPGEVDLVHIGSGPLSGQRAVLADVQRIAAALREWRDLGVPMLAIAGGWQLLGAELVTTDGERLTGAGVFPSRATLGTERHVGEAIVRTADGFLAGFENHSATTVLEGAEPLGAVMSGFGNDSAAQTRLEGIRSAAAIGTHLHGPVLPMNPQLADRLLATAVQRRGGTLPQAPVSAIEHIDRFAANARRAIAERLGVKSA